VKTWTPLIFALALVGCTTSETTDQDTGDTGTEPLVIQPGRGAAVRALPLAGEGVDVLVRLRNADGMVIAPDSNTELHLRQNDRELDQAWEPVLAPGITVVVITPDTPLEMLQQLDQVLSDDESVAVVFAGETKAPTESLEDAIAFGATWEYLDDGQEPGPDWKTTKGVWRAGPAPLGYGQGGENTIVSYGSSSSSKHITTWLRTEFEVQGDAVDTATLAYLRDDAVVVYLNGVEVHRDNLPSGEITPDTLANIAVYAAEETRVVNVDLGHWSGRWSRRPKDASIR